MCSICGTTIGVTINCATKNCRRFFHAECARVTKLNINVIKGNNTTLLEVYCDNHKFLEPCEVFKQSMISKLNHFKRLYEGISDKLKRLGISTLQLKHIKGVNIDEQPKKDVCLVCG